MLKLLTSLLLPSVFILVSGCQKDDFRPGSDPAHSPVQPAPEDARPQTKNLDNAWLGFAPEKTLEFSEVDEAVDEYSPVFCSRGRNRQIELDSSLMVGDTYRKQSIMQNPKLVLIKEEGESIVRFDQNSRWMKSKIYDYGSTYNGKAFRTYRDVEIGTVTRHSIPIVGSVRVQISSPFAESWPAVARELKNHPVYRCFMNYNLSHRKVSRIFQEGKMTINSKTFPAVKVEQLDEGTVVCEWTEQDVLKSQNMGLAVIKNMMILSPKAVSPEMDCRGFKIAQGEEIILKDQTVISSNLMKYTDLPIRD